MKKIILMLAIALGVVKYDIVAGQIPEPVLKSFSQHYPQVAVRKWTVKNDTYVSKFRMNKNKEMAYYTSDGRWVKTETALPWTKDLPVAVDNSWKHSDFCSWYVASIKEVTYPDKSQYVLKVQQDCGPDGSAPGDCLNIYNLYFAANGRLEKEVNVDK